MNRCMCMCLGARGADFSPQAARKSQSVRRVLTLRNFARSCGINPAPQALNTYESLGYFQCVPAGTLNTYAGVVCTFSIRIEDSLRQPWAGGWNAAGVARQSLKEQTKRPPLRAAVRKRMAKITCGGGTAASCRSREPPERWSRVRARLGTRARHSSSNCPAWHQPAEPYN